MRDERLGVLIHHPANVFGGAERTLSNLLERIDRTRYRVVLVASAEVFRAAPVDVFHDLATHGLADGFHDLRRSVQDARQIVALARETGCSVMLGMLHYGAIIAGLCRPLSLWRLHTIASPRTPSIAGIRFHVGEGAQARTWRRMVAMFCRFSSRVLVASDGLRRECVDVFGASPRKLRVVPNCVSAALLAAAENVAPLTRECADESTPWLIASSGRLAAEKDFPTLLRAVALLKNRLPVRLLLIGDGEERTALAELAKSLEVQELVEFAGFLTNPEIRVRTADLFVHTALFEGFGNVLLETMACGVPLVATDCDFGPREIVTDGVTGRLVPPSSPEALAEGIESMLRSPDLRHACAMEAARSLRRFDAETMAQGYLALFDELGGRRRQSAAAKA